MWKDIRDCAMWLGQFNNFGSILLDPFEKDLRMPSLVLSRVVDFQIYAADQPDAHVR